MEPTTRSGLHRAAVELAPWLLPPLLARMNRASAEFEEVARRLAGNPEEWLGSEALLARADALGGDDRRLGWCLGVLAAATGADLLGARREREGLRLLVGLLAEGRRVRLFPGADALPRVSTAMGEGWELPLAGAVHFLRAAEALTAGNVLRWRLERTPGWRVFVCPEAPRPVDPDATWRAVLDRIPGAHVRLEDGAPPALAVPDPWIED